MGLLKGRRSRAARVGAAGELRRSGDATAAVEALAPLLVESPDDPAANVEMARALQLLGDAAGAEEHYRRALRSTLSYPLVVELAGVVGAQGRLDEAAETLDAAMVMVEKDRTLDPGEVHLMRAMIAAGAGDQADAAAALDLLDTSKTSDRNREYARRLRERIAGR